MSFPDPHPPDDEPPIHPLSEELNEALEEAEVPDSERDHLILALDNAIAAIYGRIEAQNELSAQAMDRELPW